ncbi:hypothetical protein SYNPS1DRAFT_31703 [Syncephalis pseudoplumigaleata]|uniref:Uncharacterized protein n=1 Tax=Syncephalis pseudoplumigaleata TaxID=1712513 RepID=A0A4V1J0T5_9FUNG|nr:hypothetical protein SYNPS1DRAFT_31703 [Syncephalis pseudoplumigaleata]|eukprot:RKP22679.1 hypothetical protein SYNPS1DRAFT_31703 [Syncephalis pseudoplumigaleata]
MSPAKVIPSATVESKKNKKRQAVMNAGEAPTTYAKVAAHHSVPTIPSEQADSHGASIASSGHAAIQFVTTSSESTMIVEHGSDDTAAIDPMTQSNSDAAVHERGFAPGSGLMMRLAAKGAIDEVTDQYIPSSMADAAAKAASLATSIKEPLMHGLTASSSSSSSSKKEDEHTVEWQCRACREERAQDRSWSHWLQHPVTMLHATMAAWMDEADVPCERHCTVVQRLVRWLPLRSTPKREHASPVKDETWRVGPVPLPAMAGTTLAAIRDKIAGPTLHWAQGVLPSVPVLPVASDAYAAAEEDVYGRRISAAEQARRTRLTRRARQRITGLRGDAPQDRPQQERGVIAKVVGTVMGTVVGVGMALLDAVSH